MRSPTSPAAVPAMRAGVPGKGEQLGAGAVFRAYRYAPNYPGLAGRDLTPGKMIDDLRRQKQ